MELSLHGSQINLATRTTKPNNGIVNYPNLMRPNSASFGSSRRHSNRSNSSTSTKRPVSADSKHFLNFNSLKYSDRSIKLQQQKRPSSSSNILKLLLSEPIKRSWSTAEQDIRSLYKKNKSQIKQKMTSDASSGESSTSSVEEDIKDSSSGDEDKNSIEKDVKLKINLNHECLDEKLLKPGVKTKPPLPLLSNKKTLKFLLPLNNRKIKSPYADSEEDNNYNINLSTQKEQNKTGTFNAWFDDNNVNDKKIIDLPGRVSFSTNDVYAIDYSDYDNEDSIRSGRTKKSVHFFEESSKDSVTESSDSKLISSPKNTESHNSNDNEFCCSSKCNTSFGTKHNNSTITLDTQQYNNNHWKNDNETDKIIEEYKREIENINRKHELEINLHETIQTSLTNKKPNLNSLKSELPNYFSNDFLLKKTEELLETDQSKNDDEKEHKNTTVNDEVESEEEEEEDESSVVKEYYKSIENQNIKTNENHLNNFSNEKKSILSENHQDLKWNKNNNNDSASEQNYTRKIDTNTSDKITEMEKTIKSVLSTSDDSSSDVIKNYLAVKGQTLTSENNQKNSSKKKSINLIKKVKVIPNKIIKKPKSATNVNKVKTNDKITKAKSMSCLRENSNLDEFQIDKVESWMSMHEDNFNENDKTNKNSIKNYREWRETPISKTDDEGNFSLEDQVDNSSMESTYDEIVSIIKEIDSDKRKSVEYKNLKTDVEFRLKALLNSDTPDSALSEENENENDKMKEILTYLDDIDTKCDQTLEDVRKFIPPNSARSELEFSIEADIIEDVPKISDLVMFPNHQLARRIVTLSLRANELSNAIILSKEHVSHVRAEKLKTIRIEKQNTQNRLKEQKKHYENIVQRHQGFIEQLLKDKSALCDKITNMTRRFDSQSQAWEHKLETEIVRAKETVLAGEKIRREKWVRENTKKIKELTVKGLELEINKMTSNHQKEVTELKRQHQQELLDTVEEQRQKYESIEKNIRDSYAQDRESAIERERTAIRERFEKQMEVEQETFEQQKNRLLIEFTTEKERLYLDMKEKENMFDTKRENFLRDRNELVEQIKKDYKEKLKIQEIKHQSELLKLQEQFESDYSIWKREHETTLKRREVEREDMIRQQCRLERDRQIDTIISNVDTETIKNQQEFEMKFMRLKEKYDIELRDIEKSEKISRERYNETRNKLAECQATIQNEQAIRKQLEMELNHSKKMCDEFVKEKENLKDNARQEIKQEIKSLQKERDSEIQRIYGRVQKAMEKKDSTLELLQKENTILKERSLKLEAVIRQQRKDYCIK